MAAAETYDIPDLFTFAKAKFRRFHAYTMEQGGFSEYNSPTYTLVALDELGRFVRYVRDPEARELAGELYHMVWKDIADHFHAPTRQWSGPQSRAYQTLLPEHMYGMLHRATGGRFACEETEPDISEHRLVHTCPRGLESRLLSLQTPRMLRQRFFRGADGRPDAIGSTYLTPAFALGTINAGDMWNQRRPLLSYWGTAAAPSSLRLRFLHDNNDFTAAHFFSAQREGDVVAGVGFAVDGFDTHPFFDPIKNGTIRAKDLRLRFEVEGSAVAHLPQAPARLHEPWTLTDDQFSISVVLAHAMWAENEGRWERGKSEGKAWLDVVLYAGEERTFRLAELTDAACAFIMRCLPDAAKPPAPRLSRAGGRLKIALEDLEITCATTPFPLAKLFGSFSTSLV
jgi:hypothetical protein